MKKNILLSTLSIILVAVCFILIRQNNDLQSQVQHYVATYHPHDKYIQDVQASYEDGYKNGSTDTQAETAMREQLEKSVADAALQDQVKEAFSDGMKKGEASALDMYKEIVSEKSKSFKSGYEAGYTAAIKDKSLAHTSTQASANSTEPRGGLREDLQKIEDMARDGSVYIYKNADGTLTSVKATDSPPPTTAPGP